MEKNPLTPLEPLAPRALAWSIRFFLARPSWLPWWVAKAPLATLARLHAWWYWLQAQLR